jgi:hypothetical protein
VPEGSRKGPSLPSETPPQRVRLDPVDRQPLAVELEHGEPFAVTPLEVGIAGDLDLLDVEAELGAERLQVLARPLAEVAIARDVERERGQGRFGDGFRDTARGSRSPRRRA